jgi:enterochelin esterase-like enzyme
VLGVDIPGPASGFTARTAQLYLPPAARTRHPPVLPVLLLLPGEPGAPSLTTAPNPGTPANLPDPPQDWIAPGGLAGIMDTYAKAHNGLAPIVVVADPFGTGPDNPLCADSVLGNAATYLSVDVPDWVRQHLPAARTRSWAVGGYAAGGTCAVQLALRDPVQFPSFIDLAGQDGPTLGSRQLTLDRVFGGDPLAYARANPADIVAWQRFPQLSGFLAAGRDDVPYNGQTRTMAAICQLGAIPIQFYSVNGGHDWRAWRTGLELSLDWLALRLGLT